MKNENQRKFKKNMRCRIQHPRMLASFDLQSNKEFNNNNRGGYVGYL